MKRNVKLYGSLEKAAGTSSLTLDVDTQPQLFAALRGQSTSLNMALRKSQVCLAASNEDNTETKAIEQGFSFSDKARTIHICAHTDGAIGPWWVIAIEMIAVSVATAVVSNMLIGKMQTNPNGSGGSKSTMFNGAVNSTDQGGAIPIVYGKKVLVGSTIISVGEEYYNTI